MRSVFFRPPRGEFMCMHRVCIFETPHVASCDVCAHLCATSAGLAAEIPLLKNGCLVNQIVLPRSVMRSPENQTHFRRCSVDRFSDHARSTPSAEFGWSGGPKKGLSTPSENPGIGMSGKPDTGAVNGKSAFNLAITRVNRIEVVCLHSANIVVVLRTNPCCLFFRTNRREGSA